MKKNHFSLLFAGLGAVLGLPAMATDFSVSGYGTIGYARSDQSYSYQRFINDKGTFDRDSVFAVQTDARFNPNWSATVQVKMAPAPADDNRWQPTVSWAFVSWRPDNDWLLRLGKMRIPGYLNSENIDVGATFDFARVPVETSSMLKTVDFTGASFNRNWSLDNGELSLDGYWGKANADWRGYLRDGIPGGARAGDFSREMRIEAKGLALTYRVDDSTYIASFHDADARRSDGQLLLASPVLINCGGGGQQCYGTPPTPGVPATESVGIQLAYLGADIALSHDFRLMGEFVKRNVSGAQSGLKSRGSYISLLKRVERWTPYVYYAKLRSDDAMLGLYQAINGTTVTGVGAARINASQRALADNFSAFDQYSWALGTSYTLTSASKIKAEWVRTHIGITSNLVDGPSGSNISQQSINVFSLSYSFVF